MKRFNFHLIGYLIRVFSILFPFVGTMSVYGQIGDLRRVSPESQGLKSEDVKSFFDGMMAAKQGEPHGVMVLRNGEVVGELFPTPFASKYSHTLYSASKTFNVAGLQTAYTIIPNDEIRAVFEKVCASPIVWPPSSRKCFRIRFPRI